MLTFLIDGELEVKSHIIMIELFFLETSHDILIKFRIVIIGIDRMFLIISSGLCFTSITDFSERVIKILTIQTNPITLSMNRIRIKQLTIVSLYIFNRCEITLLHNELYF